METNHAKQLLVAIGRPASEISSREGWVVSRCPFGPTRHKSGVSNSPAFGIHIKPKGLSYYNCFACGASGDLMDLLFDLRKDDLWGNCTDPQLAVKLVDDESEQATITTPDYDELYGPKNKPDIPFPEWWLDSFKEFTWFPEAVAYLEARGIPAAVGKMLDLRFDSLRKRVCFPIRNWNKELVGLHGRDVTGQNKLKYYAYTMYGEYNKLVWLGESWIDPDKPVVVVESVFDLAKVYRVYRNVICGLSAGLADEKVKRIAKCLDIIAICDYGTGGEQFLKRLKKNLPDSVIQVVPLTEEEHDPGNLTVGQLTHKLDDLVQLDERI